MSPARPLTLEELEDRTAPATFGLPWRDATHLTLSFAPDGAPIAGHSSELESALSRSFPNPEEWQRILVSAFETWAVHANLSVGLRADSGDRFGVAGRMQGDARFGDIRVGAHRMAPDALAVAVPPDPFLAGTLAGDIFLNSRTSFNANTLLAAMLHEVGHALGLEHSADPESVMHAHLGNPHTTLSDSDIQAVRALYGARAPDRNEPNNSFATATQIRYTGIPAYTGLTPLVVYGDRTTATDVDYFWVEPVPLYTGPITFRLQTAGVSFLAPRLSVYDENFRLLGTAQSTSEFGDVVSVRLPQTDLSAHRYYVKVESAVEGLFGIGRYGLAVTFDGRVLTPYLDLLPAVLRGPYDTLTSENDISQLFRSPTGVLLNNDLHTDDSFLTAGLLPSVLGYPTDARYDLLASLSDGTDVDIYRIRAPQGRTVLTVTLAEQAVNGVLPVVSVFDAGRGLVSSEVLLNGNGTYVVQANGLTPGATYYLKVEAAAPPAQRVGNYFLVADFGGVTARQDTFASATLDQANPQDNYTLYVARSQLFQFVLSAGTPGVSQDVQVRMELFDRRGNLVLTLVARAGETVSGSSVLLTPGRYRLRITAEGTGGGTVPPIVYHLRGARISDPIGPAQEDPTTEPMYQSGDDPETYNYPDGTKSPEPYYVAPDENYRENYRP
jgi:Matrixin